MRSKKPARGEPEPARAAGTGKTPREKVPGCAVASRALAVAPRGRPRERATKERDPARLRAGEFTEADPGGREAARGGARAVPAGRRARRRTHRGSRRRVSCCLADRRMTAQILADFVQRTATRIGSNAIPDLRQRRHRDSGRLVHLAELGFRHLPNRCDHFI